MPQRSLASKDYDWWQKVDWGTVRTHLRTESFKIRIRIDKFLKAHEEWGAYFGSPRGDHDPFLFFLRFWLKPKAKPKKRRKTADNWPPRCASLEPNEIQEIAEFVDELTGGGNFEKTFVIERGMVDVELQIEDYHPFMTGEHAPAP